jgi:hypothetical protein
MSKITYTALRGIEATGYSKVGTDISVASTDDSFNATSTVLTGLLNNEWLLSAGFLNSVNNGWFQASANSTSTKILQDTTASLVTEAAGETVTLKGYKRGLDQVYTLEFSPSVLTRSAESINKSVRSLGGATETILHRRDVFWDINSGPISESALGQWREFLASVEGGEQFSFDPSGVHGAPAAAFPVMLDMDKYQEDRLSTSLLYGITFRLREL